LKTAPSGIIVCVTAVLVAACASRAARVQHAPESAISYNSVHEIFRESCEHCHNADKAKGGLLLDSYEALLAGGESGSAVVAGQSASSRLVQMIEGSLTPRMPYKEDPLPSAQVDVIRKWVDAGAPGPSATGEPLASTSATELVVPDVKPAVPTVGAAAAVAFDPGSRRIAVGGYKSVHLMAFADRKWSPALTGHADLVRAVAFSPDGSRLAVAGGPSGRFGEIRIWDVQSAVPKAVSTIRGHKDTILSVAFSPDGATIASASYDKVVKIWSVASGQEIVTLKEHSDAVYAVAFMPGGRHLASAAGDRTIKVWDVQSGKRLFTVNDSLDAVYALAIHPSGTHIAAAGADRMIRTWSWNGESSALVTSTFAHGDSVLGLTYSPDGSTLVSAGADRVIKVWDAVTLREKGSFDAQPDWVMGLALSGDGQWLAAGRYDGTLGLYALAARSAGEQFVVPR
jgi:WD40 repeat protein